MTERLLPAVLMGIDTPIGLAIIRDLGRRGVPVHGIAGSAAALGLASRHLTRGLLRAEGGAAAVVAQLRRLSDELGPACLFAVSESDITMLNAARAELPAYRMMFADEARMERVLCKPLTYAAAAAVGIAVPRTLCPQTLDEVTAAAPSLRYPVVLKWADPNAVAPLLHAAGIALDKILYCADAAALLRCMHRYRRVGIWPMVQEYCSGYGLGQFVLMHQGRAHCCFQHRRLHEWPPQGGMSTLCASLPLSSHATLMAQSVALLEALQWEGVAMVEYRYDPASGRAALMEVNGRFWGSLPLACHAGASFPWLSYQLLGLGKAVRQPDYVVGMRCRFMIPETKRLWRLLRGGKIAALGDYLLDFLRPRTRYFVHDWDDPAPLWRDLRGSWRAAIGMAWRRCGLAGYGK
jgi:predicted ATP-grasp superfamily ATP-dependent carboligase